MDRADRSIHLMGVYSDGVAKGEEIGKLIIENMHMPSFLYKNPKYYQWYMQSVYEYWSANASNREIEMASDEEMLITYETGVLDGARGIWEDAVMGERV